jgi:hypothetical protein
MRTSSARFVAIALAAAVMVSMPGCSGNDEPQEEAAGAVDEGETPAGE